MSERAVKVIVVIVSWLVPVSPVEGDPQNFPPRTFQIKAQKCRVGAQPRLGTGFYASVAGRSGILTALHVVVGCDYITVSSFGSASMLSGEGLIVSFDKNHDAALLSVPKNWTVKPEPFVVASIYVSGRNLPGEVELIGYPESVQNPRRRVVRVIAPLKQSDSGANTNNRQVYVCQSDNLEALMDYGLSDKFKARDSPLHTLCVLPLGFGLRAGDSGAPILNGKGEVIAFANGGLSGGDSGINWGIPLKNIKWTVYEKNNEEVFRLSLHNPADLFEVTRRTTVNGIEFVPVRVDDESEFWIMSAELTEREYASLPCAGSRAVASGSLPAILRVDEAACACRFLDSRLPTVDEWNRAAGKNVDFCSANFYGQARDRRGGGEPCTRSLGDDEWLNANRRRDVSDYLMPVRSFPANEWGLHDAYGNVAEWVEVNPGKGEYLTLGGSFNDRSPTRLSRPRPARRGTSGVRCLLDPGAARARPSETHH
jgi:hypothetical protein